MAASDDDEPDVVCAGCHVCPHYDEDDDDDEDNCIEAAPGGWCRRIRDKAEWADWT